MKSAAYCLIIIIFLAINPGIDAQPSIGGYKVYYGLLHNHCEFSDGEGTADQAYQSAQVNGHLDFFSLSDHSYMISASEWAATKAAAEKYNQPGIYTTFWGFEWTNSIEGHVTVTGSNEYVSTTGSTKHFAGLSQWVDQHDCIAFFNHPGHTDGKHKEFVHFTTPPSDKFVGMELWNNTKRFERYYYNDGYYWGDGNLSYYDEALVRGWKIGAGGSEDSHTGGWGTITDSRMAVLATANTREDLMSAMKARRFFSTYDKNMALSFKIDGNEMGSTIREGLYDVLIQASDADHEVFTKIELLRNGAVIHTWVTSATDPVISFKLNCFDKEYYYIRVKQADGDEAISSPIWISGGYYYAPANAYIHASGEFTTQTLLFDFSEGYQGWKGDFADYPVLDSAFYELKFKRSELPAPLDTKKFSLMTSGNNHSDDLFMFIKRKITGLLPNETYKLVVDIDLASDVPTKAMGIGGSPGESVTIKAGATLIEPQKVDSNGYFRINIDKSNQVMPGKDMDTLGNIGVTDTTSVYTLIKRSNATHPFTISTDENGVVWVCIGTDSGFEGKSTLYYSNINLTFESIAGRYDTGINNDLVIFPDPVTDWLIIHSRSAQVTKIDLYNMNGQIVMSASYTDRLSLRSFQPGAYVIRITFTDNSVVTRKIIKD